MLCYGLFVVEFMKELLFWHTYHHWDGTGLGLGPDGAGLWDTHDALQFVVCSVNEQRHEHIASYPTLPLSSSKPKYDSSMGSTSNRRTIVKVGVISRTMVELSSPGCLGSSNPASRYENRKSLLLPLLLRKRQILDR
jgi:hypothetical protein